MKCEKCGKLYGNMKDDKVVVNPHLGQLCINCWGENRPPLKGVNYGYGNINEKRTMKIFKCPDCKDVREKEDDILMVQCPCGGHMVEVDSEHNPIRNEMEKTCDENKCESCPIRGLKCF